MSEMQDRMRKALQQPAPGEHPSAEMLNAYAEHALTAAEQHGVAEHLAACRGCREVLFLVSACEEAERSQAAASLPKRRVRWWTWAVPVAAVLAVGSTVLVMHPWQTNLPRQEMAAKQAAPPPPSATEETASASEKTSASDVATMLKDAPRKEKAVRQAPAAAPAVTSPKEQERTGEDKSEPTLMTQNKVDAVQPAAKSAQLGAAAGVGGNRDAMQNAPAAQDVEGGMAAARAPAPAAPANTTVEVSSEAALLDAQPSSSTNETLLTKKTNAKRMAASSTAEAYGLRKQVDRTWVVTGTGLLEHLAEGSWHTVPVAKNAYITVVTAVGDNVWAAARGGALYYSANGGGRWERLVAPGGPELVGLTAVSATELRARTAEGKNLVSQDGGKTWAEQ